MFQKNVQHSVLWKDWPYRGWLSGSVRQSAWLSLAVSLFRLRAGEVQASSLMIGKHRFAVQRWTFYQRERLQTWNNVTHVKWKAHGVKVPHHCQPSEPHTRAPYLASSAKGKGSSENPFTRVFSESVGGDFWHQMLFCQSKFVILGNKLLLHKHISAYIFDERENSQYKDLVHSILKNKK